MSHSGWSSTSHHDAAQDLASGEALHKQLADSEQRLMRAQALGRLVGSAPAFVNVTRHISAASRSDATILLSGETGTGKELFARAVHYSGTRSGYPFVPVNCGALLDLLFEDELFGHDRGAYTDAKSRRIGLVAEAEKGTLFLDEIDALSLKAQVALLRLLQERSFRALGSNVEQKADVRIIAATNANLPELVRKGSFRSDLYFRLCILSLRLPSLQERREDVLPLAMHFLQKHNRTGRPLKFADDVRAAMLGFGWPGNVRQLENAVIRGCELCEGNLLGVEQLGLECSIGASSFDPIGDDRPFQEAKQQLITQFEKVYLTQLIARHVGNVSSAARAAKKERRELGRLLKKHHIDPKQFTAPQAYVA